MASDTLPTRRFRLVPDPGDPAAHDHPGAVGPPPTGFRLGHRPWLDGLRGIAILAVLGYHLRLFTGGIYGVDLFFVLSGFLITCLLAEEWGRTGRIRLRQFYLRRALRLLPAFVVLLVVGYLTVRWGWPEREPAFRKAVLAAALYVSNWPDLHGTDLFLLTHTWSLSVEEQFYLLWPVLLLLMLRAGLPRWTILLAVTAGIGLIAGHRAVLFLNRPPLGHPDWDRFLSRVYMGLDTRGDALLVGCLVGLLAAWNLLPTARWACVCLRWASLLALTGLGLLFLYDRSAILMYEGGFTLLAVLAGLVIAAQLAAPTRVVTRVLSCPPLAGVGRVSYALYLFHVPILAVYGHERVGWGDPVGIVLVSGLSIGAAVLSFYVIERPFLRLKDRLRSRPVPIPHVVPLAPPTRRAA